jgi:hypothetical protein
MSDAQMNENYPITELSRRQINEKIFHKTTAEGETKRSKLTAMC